MTTPLEVEGLGVELDGFSLGPLAFRVAAREALLVFGPSLAGKTQLLKALVGLVPARGRVRIAGAEAFTPGGRPNLAVRGQVGMVFQNDALFDSLTVRENVALPLARRRIQDADIRITRALEAVGLSAASAKLPEQLSGGMRKRAGLARAIATEPALLLVDEPLAGLDPGTQLRIARLLAEARDRGAALVIAVADPTPLWEVCGQAIALEAGRVLAQGPSAAVRERCRALLGAA